MGDNGRTWIIPKTTKLIPLDIAMPSAKTTLSRIFCVPKLPP